MIVPSDQQKRFDPVSRRFNGGCQNRIESNSRQRHFIRTDMIALQGGQTKATQPSR
jgi:hypothetical protein